MLNYQRVSRFFWWGLSVWSSSSLSFVNPMHLKMATFPWKFGHWEAARLPSAPRYLIVGHISHEVSWKMIPWLVVWNMAFLCFYDFPYIGKNSPNWLSYFSFFHRIRNFIIPTDFQSIIFQRDSNHQPVPIKYIWNLPWNPAIWIFQYIIIISHNILEISHEIPGDHPRNLPCCARFLATSRCRCRRSRSLDCREWIEAKWLCMKLGNPYNLMLYCKFPY